MNWKQVSAAAAMAAALIVAPPAIAQLAEGVAAIVNDHVISTFDVRQRAGLILMSAGLQDTPELQQRARAQALQDLINDRLEIEAASQYTEIKVTPEQVDQRLGEIAQQNHLDVATLSSQLASRGVSIETLRTQIRADMMWQRLVAGRYSNTVRVSESEISETLNRIAANATKPQYLLSEIFLPARSPQEFTDMQQGAMHLLEQMQHGAPFPLVARQFSQAPSAAAGGDIGWIPASDLSAELQPVADRLQKGQVSLPIRGQTGVWIIAMRDRRDGAPTGSTTLVTLKQISAPAARATALGRAQHRIDGCGDLDRIASSLGGGGQVVDLGQTAETDLSSDVRSRIDNVATGAASEVVTSGDSASVIVVCARDTGGGGVPSRDDIETRLRGDELNMLSDRYLRDLRREATIITRQ